METPKKTIVDIASMTEYQVDLTPEEIVAYEASIQEAAEFLAAEEQARLDAEAKTALKVAALGRLGLTEEEINAFLA